MWKVAFLIVFLSSVFGKNEEYKGYKVYNIKIKNDYQEENLYKLKSDLVDYWKRPSLKHGVTGKAMVPPSHFTWFEEALQEIGVEKDIAIEDVYEYLISRDETEPEGGEGKVFNFDSYHRYDVILDHLYNLQNTSFESSAINLEVVEYGRTEQNRPLVYLKISSNASVDIEKPTVVLEAGINPREWATISAALKIVSVITEDENRSLIDDLVWIIIPVLNPDGYEYTHTNLRFWTKSLSLNNDMGFICPGVHLDRNFNIDWLNQDSSSSGCSHVYAGTEPFSEIETQLVRDLIDQYKPEMYISIQSNGRIVTFPWKYEMAATGLFRRHLLLGSELVKEVDGYILDSGAIAVGDRVSGTSTDYARRNGAIYSFNIGIEGQGEDGVLVPEEDLNTVVEDIWRIVIVAARYLTLDDLRSLRLKTNISGPNLSHKTLGTQLHLDIWPDAVPGRNSKVLVPRHLKTEFLGALATSGVKFEVESENIKEQLDLEDRLLAAGRTKSNRTRDGGLTFDTIHTYEVVNDYLDELAEKYDTVTVATAGQSIEGRDIKYLKISTTNFEDRSKPVIFVQSLLHSREWVTLQASLYAIKKLVLDVTERHLVEEIDWIILPVANPDGYVASHNGDRFWRKNRRRGIIINDICFGVDLNRNFDSHWGSASNNFVCAEDYHGAGPFSEPEAAAIRDVLLEHGGRTELYIDLHSFGSMVLYGYGTGELPWNALGLHVLGVNMAQAIDRVKWPENRNYIVGNIPLVLGYYASGGTSDYAMDLGIPFSYTYELPAYRNIQGQLNGFLVDPDFIEQAGHETWEGLRAGANFVLTELRMKKMARHI